MSRVTTSEPIVVRPQNNVYTALAAVALVTVILGLVALYLRWEEIFPTPMFG